MNDILKMNIVLVLNRNWQAINTTTPAQAFCSMATDVATGLDIHVDEYMQPTRWVDWVRLPVREGDGSVRTASGLVRLPTVIVLAKYSKVPMRRPSFSLRAIRARDGNRCQYTGKMLAPDEGNIDHVIPRSRGGATSWRNCVLASVKVNSKKAAKTPREAGLKLIRQPAEPPTLPATMLLRNPHDIADWHVFLGSGKT